MRRLQKFFHQTFRNTSKFLKYKFNLLCGKHNAEYKKKQQNIKKKKNCFRLCHTTTEREKKNNIKTYHAHTYTKYKNKHGQEEKKRGRQADRTGKPVKSVNFNLNFNNRFNSMVIDWHYAFVRRLSVLFSVSRFASSSFQILSLALRYVWMFMSNDPKRKVRRMCARISTLALAPVSFALTHSLLLCRIVYTLVNMY